MKKIVLRHKHRHIKVKNNQIDKVDGLNSLISGMQAKIFPSVCQQLEKQITLLYSFSTY